jgi:hypothetical protein
MSMGFRAESTNTSGVITVAGVDQVVINNAGDVAATTFTGALVGNAATATALSTATGAAPVYGARAWASFNGRNNTSNVLDLSNTNRFIYGSANVSNVLRTGTGLYTVNFSISMPDVNYAMIGTCADENDDSSPVLFYFTNSAIATKTVSSQAVRIGISGINYDTSLVNLVVFR